LGFAVLLEFGVVFVVDGDFAPGHVVGVRVSTWFFAFFIAQLAEFQVHIIEFAQIGLPLRIAADPIDGLQQIAFPVWV